MGTCQSIGGASTSGASLTAHDVAAALRAIIDHPMNAHVENTTDICEPADDPPMTWDLRPGVSITCYAPQQFAALRKLNGISDEHFVEEWTLAEEGVEMALGAGRSQALFLRSQSQQFISKTIAEGEVDVLLSILASYREHMERFPSSLLMRFLALVQIKTATDVGYVVCSNDVFAAATTLHERWDVKGRLPKPGKFVVESQPSAATEPVKEAESPASMSSPILHDKDLRRLFWIDAAPREALLGQLHEDFAYAERVGLMDYSILIGVCYTPAGKTSGSGFVSSLNEVRAGHAEYSAEERPTSPLRPSSIFQSGVESVRQQETYFIGIIDVLTVYTWKKKSANFFKSFLWKPITLSTIPPAAYRARLERYTHYIFPSTSSSS